MAVPHIGFILAAYAITAAVLLGTVAAILLDRHALRRALDRLGSRRGARPPLPESSAERPTELARR